MIITGVLLVLLALLGAPLFAIIAVSALLGFGRIGVDPMVVPMEMYRIAETPVLLAPPVPRQSSRLHHNSTSAVA